MKPSIYRRIRRRTATEAATSKKENKQESSFFGEAASEHFFQPATVISQPPVINRKCKECEQEDKKVQRAEDKKEEDKKLQRMTDKKEEEKLQRQPEKKEEEKLMKKGEEKEEEKIQKKEAGNPTSTPVTSSYINSLNSKGTPLPKQSQQFFGSRMGYDFSHVKVHTDRDAAQSAKEVNAKAYTTGEHIVFNEGQYDTNSAEGKKLMAHELAHVVQQPKNNISKKDDHSFWFKDPAKQKKSEDEDHIETSAEARERVFIESQIQPVADKKTGSIEIKVRFAYPSTEMSTQTSKRVSDAKQKVVNIILGILNDLNTLPPASDAKARANDETTRAKLKEALKSKEPINIFLQTDPSAKEMQAGMVAAYTNRVYVDLNDVGNEAKLKAAISVPVMMVTGGVMPQGQSVPASSDEEFKEVLLHEMLHRMLIERSLDAEAVYKKTEAKRIIKGDQSIGQSFKALMADFFVAQEEVFVYNQIAELYATAPRSKKGEYETFLRNVTSLLKTRNMKLNAISNNLDVSEKVNKKKVKWLISFLSPEGTIEAKTDDKKSIDLLLGTFPH